MYRRSNYTADERRFNTSTESYSADEAELYKYNLPPKYDGSLFIRRTDDEHNIRSDDIQPIDEPAPEISNEPSGNSEGSNIEYSGEEHGSDPQPSIIETLREHIGSEELLITALLLILGSGDGNGDIMLFLALLLIGA